MPDRKKSRLPIVAITMGDPCGVGPEVIVKAFGSAGFARGCIPLVIGNELPMRHAIDLIGAKLQIKPVKVMGDLPTAGDLSAIPLFAVGNLTLADILYGRPTPEACKTTVACIETAVSLTISRKTDAVCTCPVNKAQLHANGFPFPGHTEFIRDLTSSSEVVMMLAGPKLRVALATIHEPLSEVPGLITRERLRDTIRITAEAMVKDFGMKLPRIAVAGLNPHAGEAGKFGREEIEVIEPAIREFAADSRFQISGPWPPDTVFHRALSGEFDAVIAMYHDQGLIAVKLAHFSDAVNVSLGLPIIRTSVDHGTAYDIAGTGKADPGSLIAAVELAAFIAGNRQLAISD